MIQEDDKFLQNMFSNYQPELGSNVDFMDALNKKLDAVEYIKAYQDAQVRNSRMAVILSLVCGIAVGCILSVLLMLTPMDVPLFAFQTTNAVLLLFQQYSRLIFIVAMSGFCTWGIVNLVTELQEMSPFKVTVTCYNVNKSLKC